MSNFDVSYFVKIKNQFSGPAKKIASSAHSIIQKVKILTKKLPKLELNFKKIAASAKKAGKAMTNLGQGLSVKLTAPLALFGAVALKQSAILETLSVSFDTMLGSATKSKELMTDLLSFTATTPFQLQGVAQSAKSLLAFGVIQEKMIPTLRMLGDIAAGASVPLKDMAQIFGKAKSKGKLMTEEILQMAERGIPIVSTLAEGFGVTKAKIFEMASKSQISFDVMKQALSSMTKKGGIFFGQTVKQSETLAGRWSTLKDNFLISAAAIGDVVVESIGLNKILKDMAEGLVPLANRIKVFAREHPNITKMIIAFTGILVVLGPLIILFGQLAFGISSIITVVPFIVSGFAAIGGAVLALTTAFIPLAIAVGTAAAPFILIGAAIFGVFKLTTLLGELFSSRFPKTAEAMTNAIQNTFGGLFAFIQDASGGFSKFFSFLSADLLKVITDVSLAFTDIVQSVFGNLFGFIDDSIGRISGSISKIKSFIGGKITSIDAKISESITGGASSLDTKISESIVRDINIPDATAIAPGNSQTDVNINLRAPEGTIERIKTRTTGNGANVGTNMRAG